MSKKGALADVVWALPWIVKLVLAIFFEFVYGICRFVDGILQANILKVLIGLPWIFYGLVIGWVLDIICVALNKRPFFF